MPRTRVSVAHASVAAGGGAGEIGNVAGVSEEEAGMAGKGRGNPAG